jgi:hypothetical protein
VDHAQGAVHLALGQGSWILQQRPPCPGELTGIDRRGKLSHLPPKVFAYLFEGLGSQLNHMKWIETDLGVRCLLAEGLGKGSDRDPWWAALILVVRSFPRSSKNSSRLFALFPSACVDDLARLVIGDKREVVVTFAITDLIDPENEEIIKAVGIELLGDDSFTDRPYRTPGDS